ncbi:MAG: chemotaxis protein CheW [Polyangiales bacterium]
MAFRQQFDGSFAIKREGELAVPNAYLALRLGGQPYAVRLGDVGGLFVERHITPVPSPMTELLGLAGFRGAPLPVYDLAALLGHAPTTLPRWLMTDASTSIAFAFAEFEGHVHVGDEALKGVARGADANALLGESLAWNGTVRPLLRLAAVVDAVKARTPKSESSEGTVG